jgi:hypothetical protein
MPRVGTVRDDAGGAVGQARAAMGLKPHPPGPLATAAAPMPPTQRRPCQTGASGAAPPVTPGSGSEVRTRGRGTASTMALALPRGRPLLRRAGC